MEDELRRIAERVKRWRLDAGLTLQDVSEVSGVSASTVHKIENLQTVPTISVLIKVAHGLGRRPDELFDSVPSGSGQVALIRADSRDILQTREGAVLGQVAGAISEADIDVWRVTHAQGFGSRARPDSPPLRYRGELVILVETGRLHVEVGDEEYELGPGDTLHFKTSLPHSWDNRSDAPVSLLCFGLLPGAARRQG